MASRGCLCRAEYSPVSQSLQSQQCPKAHRPLAQQAANDHRDARKQKFRIGALLAVTAAALGAQGSAVAAATDIAESYGIVSTPVSFVQSEENDRKLAEAEEAFLNSPLLKELKERSEKNAEMNRRDIEAKYCSRQAELGIGDCGGLRYIPGMTKSGKQKTPGWLGNILGVEAEEEVGAEPSDNLGIGSEELETSEEPSMGIGDQTD